MNPSQDASIDGHSAVISKVKPDETHESVQCNPAIPGRLDTNLDAVEAALAKALEGAAAAGRFDVVAQLARELEARRARRANVIDLSARRLAEK